MIETRPKKYCVLALDDASEETLGGTMILFVLVNLLWVRDVIFSTV